MKQLFFSCLALLMLSACNRSKDIVTSDNPDSGGESVAKVWITNGGQSKLLKEENISVTEGETVNTTAYKITLDKSEKLQEIDGFGAALTGSSAYLINQKLNVEQRQNLLKELFSADGIGISYLRVTMGASDFSLHDFTYNDLEAGQTDPNLTRFSIEEDRSDLIPVLKQIKAINQNIKIMASPWSPPAWMKTNGKLAGGKLKPEWYESYAHYFVKYIRAYENEGITIDAISVQNEPLHEAAYPSLRMEPEEQLDFIKNHLGPLLKKENIKTQILLYDHNWDRPDYPITILNDQEAAKYVAGSAFHAYGGDVSAMTKVHDAHPEKGLYFTEISGGEWAKNFKDNMIWNMKNIFIGSTRNWSKNALLWNLALDENFGPINNGCADCRGVVTIKSDSKIDRNVEYYVIAHMSKFVKPGAKRLFTAVLPNESGLEQVAFVNPDDSLVLVMLNSSTSSQKFVVEWEGKQFSYVQEPSSTATYVIAPTK